MRLQMRRQMRQQARWRGVLRRAAWTALGLVLAVLLLDRLFPLPKPGRDSAAAALVVASDGTPLRAFPDRDHVWRHPVRLEEVSPYYVEALLRYEDRAFWWHAGVNPFAFVRALWQRALHGRVVSGGSTLTMQVARIIDPMPHSLAGKLRQVLRAFQLEMHYSKREILTIYLNYAPMGGVLEGVEAASRAYLGKSARRLSPAEAAMLTVLPQAPSVLRPDRYPERTRRARDKVIARMAGRWDAGTLRDALRDPIAVLPLREPMLAPLLAERARRARPGQARIDTLIDAGIQSALEAVLTERAATLPKAMSIATLVMDNDTLDVVAYAGSADFTDRRRSGFVDMVQAGRSPGSTLKPFLYGYALDDGLIHSESLLVDAPQSFHGYAPTNFSDSYHGAVSVSEALVQSLNVPAVDLLDRIGPAPFLARLRQGGLRLSMPPGASANLSAILGGGATTLEQLVGAYRSLARKGVAGEPRLLADSPRREHRMLSEGAAFIVRDILESGGGELGSRGDIPGVAWKTGTSYGFRDAWAVGVNDRYTVGVWIGRPDGTPNPGFFGVGVAEPLLMRVFGTLARGSDSHPVPSGVEKAGVCWPLGRRASDDDPAHCLVRRSAWLLNGTAPPTLADRLRNEPAVQSIQLDQASGLRVTPECSKRPYTTRQVARWPILLEPWLASGLRQAGRPPAWAPQCQSGTSVKLHIEGVRSGEIVRARQGGAPPTLELLARGAESDVHWLLNGVQFGRSAREARQRLVLRTAGVADITAVDENGHFDHVRLRVETDKM
ncbi:MAG: penicillin-binding protein 1C [Pseudomonadota bacterium]